MLLELKQLFLLRWCRSKLSSTLDKALKENFRFKKMVINDYQVKLKTIAFAKSFADLNGTKITAHRKLERSSKPSWETTSAVVELPFKVLIFDRGEDPRLFIYNGQNWVMIQKFIPTDKDIEITIYNLETDELYNLQSPLGFNGKNWVPYEHEYNLFFIYSLEPFVVMKANFVENNIVLTMEKQEKGFNPIWEHDPLHSIGWVRGGTPALKVPNKEYFVGFSHSININNDIHAHTFGIYLFNPRTFCIQHKQLSKYLPNLLMDPYGLRILKKKCEVDISIGILDIHDPSSTVANITFNLDISDILQMNFSKEELKAVE